MAELAKSVLEDIIALRRRRVEETRAGVPLGRLEHSVEKRTDYRDFAQAISGGSLRVIAELKRASPSRGALRRDYNPGEIARSYETAGASAHSVLTEQDFFGGSLEDLKAARGTVKLPVLRKDFILDVYQVYESVAAGADALLLIVAALSDEDLRNLLGLCERLRIAALVEVHTEAELDGALGAGARLIGVNNRNLKTLEVNLETSFRLRERIPATCLAVSESGIKTPGDLRRLAEAGFNAILIGERFMTEADPGKALADLLRLVSEGAPPVAER
ncbi:MAG: indole-3-glycerol phosphate synthase TrpC [Acidobacteria bacterium]|nr:indole-3-glycerol phosphate synthase TrpC [Acidobacteriota bacterium]